MTNKINNQINIDTASKNESAQRLETIKNLIFGEQIQQIDSEFDTIKKHIEKRKEEIQALIENTHLELSTTIDNLSTDLNIRITELDDKLNEKAEELNHNKVNKKELGSLLVSMGEKILNY
ncbi:fructose 1,6-bisphosphatase [uncultured Flavobacterium sp.]|uniref:fructose 1,6-bisphosphatase n=1 Tax=uncultured Flavobacterium sp. TaxID=165435 RepID=UPI0030CA1C55